MSLSSLVLVVKQQGTSERRLARFSAHDGCSSDAVLQIEIMRQNTEREKRTNPNLTVRDSNLEAVSSATQTSEHGFVRVTRSRALMKLNTLGSNVWEDNDAPFVAVDAPSERDE